MFKYFILALKDANLYSRSIIRGVNTTMINIPLKVTVNYIHIVGATIRFLEMVTSDMALAAANLDTPTGFPASSSHSIPCFSSLNNTSALVVS